MNIAVIGGGFTGLTAAYRLTKAGHKVTVFEKEPKLGGLANGFKEKSWDWSLEKTYHHWFTNDLSVLSLLNDLNLKDKLMIKRPITANYWHGGVYQFDSVGNFLNYPGLAPAAKIRTAALIAFLKINPFWQPLEALTAQNLIKFIGGEPAWRELWQPLMQVKFGNYSSKIAASWFWARIKKRTPSLGYIEGGFGTLVEALSRAIKQNGGIIYAETAVSSVNNKSANLQIEFRRHSSFNIRHLTFDRVLLTIPTPIAAKLVPRLTTYNLQPTTIPHLHAQTLILETKEPILRDTYWLNILDRSFPFLTVVAHTNFMDPSHYGGRHLTYFGNYLPPDHPYLSMTKEQLLKVFDPYINKLNPSYRLSLITYHLFTAPFAQPVHLLHYSKLAPSLITAVPGLYLANLDSIYPWDRGTNYAVELGKKAAHMIIQSDKKEAK